MRKRTATIGLISGGLLLAGALFTIFKKDEAVEKHYTPRNADGSMTGYLGAERYYNLVRSNVRTGKVEPSDIIETRKAAKRFERQRSAALDLEWKSKGPSNIGGRTRAILIDQDNRNVMYAGSVSGGVWKSNDGGGSWRKLRAFNSHFAVSCMAQAGNGTIYVGTGSSHDGPSGIGGSGFLGGGFYMSKDGGASFQLVKPSFVPDSNQAWRTMDEMVADPSDPDGIWVANNGGLHYWDQGKETLERVTDIPTTNVDHVVVSADGGIVAASTNFGSVYVSWDGGENFTEKTAAGSNNIPSTGVGRAELAISKDDPSFMYASLATTGGSMRGVYASVDSGRTWHEIMPGNNDLNIFRNQGNYDNAISVYPGEPDRILLGGVKLYEWKRSPNNLDPPFGQWEQIASTNAPPESRFFVHADVHNFTWNRKDERLYIGTDGGITISPDMGEVFFPSNRGYVTTQAYGIAFSKDDKVMEGTQDNGTYYVDHEGVNYRDGRHVFGGDGFDCDISHMNPNIMFASSQFGTFQRSSEEGDNFKDFRSNALANSGCRGGFYTTIRLFEDQWDADSPDSVLYVNTTDSTLYQGDSIYFESRTSLQHKVGTTLRVGQLEPDSALMLQDPKQSIFAVGYRGDCGIWITRDALRLAEEADWWQIIEEVPNNGTVGTMEFSKDGNHLYFATRRSGDVYRISGLDSAYRDSTASYDGNDYQLSMTKIHGSNSVVTSLAVDPNDPDHVVITKGQYGGGDKVMESTNATSASVNFTSIWNNLPSGLEGMPVYEAEIHRDDPATIIIGTEFGVYATDDGGNTWNPENGGDIDLVPVFDVRQQWRGWNQGAYLPGATYIGTHGRGIMKTGTLVSVEESEAEQKKEKSPVTDLKVYPNPVRDHATFTFELNDPEEVRMHIRNMKGKLVRQLDPAGLTPGRNQVRVDLTDLSRGTYFLNIASGERNKVAKFIVTR